MENERILLLLKACQLTKKRNNEQDGEDAVMVSMAQTAYNLGRADAMAEAEREKK